MGAQRWAVMLECRAGTMRLIGDAWEDDYHVITWTTEDTEEKARDEARRQKETNPREVRRAWAEPYEKRCP